MAPPPLHSLLRLSPLLLFLLLLAPLQPALGLDLSAGLQEDLGSLPEETCMSIQQLSDAVKLAAWTVPGINNADGTPRKAVIITTCNLGCLKVRFGLGSSCCCGFEELQGRMGTLPQSHQPALPYLPLTHTCTIPVQPSLQTTLQFSKGVSIPMHTRPPGPPPCPYFHSCTDAV